MYLVGEKFSALWNFHTSLAGKYKMVARVLIMWENFGTKFSVSLGRKISYLGTSWAGITVVTVISLTLTLLLKSQQELCLCCRRTWKML
jgi:hypothetical protein